MPAGKSTQKSSPVSQHQTGTDFRMLVWCETKSATPKLFTRCFTSDSQPHDYLRHRVKCSHPPPIHRPLLEAAAWNPALTPGPLKKFKTHQPRPPTPPSPSSGVVPPHHHTTTTQQDGTPQHPQRYTAIGGRGGPACTSDCPVRLRQSASARGSAARKQASKSKARVACDLPADESQARQEYPCLLSCYS
jgi:hypothetical protein